MVASNARVATESPTLYLTKLCEHFADSSQRHGDQQFEVSFDDREGLIDLAPVVDGAFQLDARQEGVLVIDVRGANQDAVERIQRIVAKHLERFGGLTVEWGAVSEQRSPE